MSIAIVKVNSLGSTTISDAEVYISDLTEDGKTCITLPNELILYMAENIKSQVNPKSDNSNLSADEVY